MTQMWQNVNNDQIEVTGTRIFIVLFCFPVCLKYSYWKLGLKKNSKIQRLRKKVVTCLEKFHKSKQNEFKTIVILTFCFSGASCLAPGFIATCCLSLQCQTKTKPTCFCAQTRRSHKPLLSLPAYSSSFLSTLPLRIKNLCTPHPPHPGNTAIC